MSVCVCVSLFNHAALTAAADYATDRNSDDSTDDEPVPWKPFPSRPEGQKAAVSHFLREPFYPVVLKAGGTGTPLCQGSFTAVPNGTLVFYTDDTVVPKAQRFVV